MVEVGRIIFVLQHFHQLQLTIFQVKFVPNHERRLQTLPNTKVSHRVVSLIKIMEYDTSQPRGMERKEIQNKR